MLSHGIRSALGVPIVPDGHAAAGLNLYATTPDVFDPTALAAADTPGKEASQLLRMAVHIAHLTATNHHLTQAMSTQTTIDAAAGIIMAQNRWRPSTRPADADLAVKFFKQESKGTYYQHP
ncbi:hypothetical protein ACX80U_11765 [Arthrobacter sp. TmT3-37]